MIWQGDTYRQAVVKYIKDNNISIEGRDNYQFGIFTGTTLVFIYEMFRKYGLDVKKILAFDSFEGLPFEKEGIPKHPIWQKSEFNMKYIFKTNNTKDIIASIESKLPDHDIPIEWYEGYFNQVLNGDFMKKNPKPAFYVDLDVDLYTSTIDVLDFMLKNKLIVKDTLTGYDDWGGY